MEDNAWLVGARAAIEDYPGYQDFEDLAVELLDLDNCTGCNFKKGLSLLFSVYKQYKEGKISQDKMVWAIGELYRLVYET